MYCFIWINLEFIIVEEEEEAEREVEGKEEINSVALDGMS